MRLVTRCDWGLHAHTRARAHTGQAGPFSAAVPPSPLPLRHTLQDRPDGPEFGAASPEETPKDELMAKLKEAGLSGQMFDKESLKGMAGAAGGGDGDEEDDSAEL